MILSMLVGVVGLFAAIPLPQTPVGQKFGAWLRAIESGDEKLMRAVHAGEDRADELTARDRGLAQRTGGLEVVRIERATDTEIEVTARERATEVWMNVRFAVEAAPPHKIAMVGLRPGAAPDDGPQPKLADADAVRQLGAYVDKLAADGRFSGTVLVAHNGKAVLEKAYGLASRAWNAPMRVDTKLNLGSMNKMFTALAVMQLVDKGKVGLDDKVGKHLPDFANAVVRDTVTVRQLLTHTSGLGSFFNDKFEEKKLGIREVADYLPLIDEEKLAFAPGSKWSYSNSGFILLGAIIEKASGENYFDYVREHIYKPAGMKDTDCYDVDRDTPNLATGYTRDDAGTWRSNIFMHTVRGGPAGGGYSTVGDLLRFANALQAGTLLPPALVKDMTTGKVAAQMGKYAFGFGDEAHRGHRVVGHSGGFPGINANLDIFWDDGWVVAVMANVDMGAMPVAQKARDLIAR
jgi:CubicO group peptidase (beta-lactamase class C family)